jgi:hypothetical protein
MERQFWVLLIDADVPEPAAERDDFLPLGVIRPLWRESLFVAGEPALPVFTSEVKAHAFARHVEEAAVAAVRMTQAEIQEHLFEGRPNGHCTVDPTADHPGEEISVNGLHLK